jgi:hypothetical protein
VNEANDDHVTLLLKPYRIPVSKVENHASKFQKLCTFSGVNTGSEDHFEMSKAVSRTEKAMYRIEGTVGELKSMLSAIMTKLDNLLPVGPLAQGPAQPVAAAQPQT